MTMIDLLMSEVDNETRTTRRHLERLPDEKLDWRPHEKSFSARELASHIVECVRWAESIFSRDELDMDPIAYKSYQASSVGDLLKTFDEDVARCKQALASASEAMMMQPWRLKLRGKLKLERPKAAAFRDFTLSHVIHHRGQLSVYLRLLNVPVPGSYGPTADDQ
jgi:uncharacterized damage-inducible protein DinB